MTKDWLERQVTAHLERIVSWMKRQDYHLTKNQHQLLMEIVSIDKRAGREQRMGGFEVLVEIGIWEAEEYGRRLATAIRQYRTASLQDYDALEAVASLAFSDALDSIDKSREETDDE